MGLRVARGRAGAVAQGADRRRRRDRNAGDRAARPARRVRRHCRRRRGAGDGRGEAAMMRFLRSSFVIARRDFAATVLSKAFIFFLLGPLFPLLLGGVFGSIGARVATQTERPAIAVIAPSAEFQRLNAAREQLADAIGADSLVKLVGYAPEPD